MLITDKNELKKYTTPNRLWQGIPSIEVTKKGRIFMTFYSGGIDEEIGNFSMVTVSDDGVNFSEPIAVAVKDDNRCYDPCLWIDPLGRLWFTWAESPFPFRACGVICYDPDADELEWGEPFEIGREVMMNKPTVLSTGEWLFPIAVWDIPIKAKGITDFSSETDRRAFAYKSVDNGKTFEKIGGVDMPRRSFDEHMILELNDGRLAMYVRTNYGIGVSYSYDRGKTWTKGENSGYGGPCSRFHIRRLKSGRILLVNHYNFQGRNNLTAMLSEDDGKTWKYKLLLDGRNSVSYPDATEAEDGYIYIAYDRERGCNKHSLKQTYADAREILYAKITEQDIIAGRVESAEGRLACVTSKLGRYINEDENPYNELDRYSDAELIGKLADKSKDEIINLLFEQYSINCINMHRIDGEKLDALIAKLEDGEKGSVILEIVALLRSVTDGENKSAPIIDKVKNAVRESLNEDVSVAEIADRIGISRYYMCHIFKKTTGITVTDYKNELKITKAKEMLLRTDAKIADIAYACGFGSSSYFSKMFLESEHVSPSQYRELLGKNN